MTRAALRFAPLVFVRLGELRAAEWKEFDLDQATWRIPGGAHEDARGTHRAPIKTSRHHPA